MRIGIATCSDIPRLTDGDQLFAEELSRRGLEPVPFIWDQTNVLEENWNAVIIRSVWDYHRKVEGFLKWLSQIESRSIPVINAQRIIRWNSKKNYLLELQKSGVRIVPSVLIERPVRYTDGLNTFKNFGWSDLVLKPTVSASAYLTFRTSVSDPMLPDYLEQIGRHSDILVQPYFPSIETDGEISLVFFRIGSSIIFSHSVLKRPKAGEFRVQADFGGSEQLITLSREIIDFGHDVLNRIPQGWNFARVDVVNWKQDPLLGELELIEPDLFFKRHPPAAELLVDAVESELRS